ncbi:MAG TPA: hypothetical protein GXX75_09520 [Clostridiales bacterium]|nr:hypothetical protein [Clostridiales bacterium]
MKKLGKFIFGTLAAASVAAGAYYFYKTYIKKDDSDDFEDFEDDFEDFDTEDLTENEVREYVPINIASDSDTEEEDTLAEEKDTSEVQEDQDPEEEQ